MGKPDIYVITGGGGGIGVACARRLGKKGTLLLNDVDSDRVSKAAAQLRSEGFNVETIIEDISKEGGARRAAEWGEHGARLNSISPGLTDASMLRGDTLAQPELIKGFIEMASEHRSGRPEEIANAVCFLMSEEASFINGSELLVDGGLIANMRRNG